MKYQGAYTSMADVFRACLAKTNGVTANTKPQYTQQAQIERLALEQRIAENKAKLETFRAQETEFRALLVSAYGSMAYHAERAKFKVEVREWREGVSLEAEYQHVSLAIDAHTNCIEQIDWLERSIAEDQAELDDDALWVTDAGYRRNAGVR